MRARTEIAGFMYHEVTDRPRETGFQRPGAVPYTLSRAAFARHLEQFRLGSLSPELVTTVDFTRPARHLLLTFDDGGRGAVYIGDRLARLGWKGHFFVITGRIGQRTFLDPGQIRYLQSCGHLIGSHSHTHPDIFRELTRAAMVEEWRVSRDILEQILGEPCPVASVPGGDLSPLVAASAGDAGLGFLFTSEPWLAPRQAGGCRLLGRYVVKATTKPARVRALSRFRGWRRALLVRGLKVTARRSLPPLYRLYVRWTAAERPDADAGPISAW
ncbi:MAG TPA: polysaccharide deacetylase family protein [Gemmatimonadales bacterium]|jgi:peptidoglycan/xylan/chitin deacetylase (PgdA/CDA1 family)|nr:polysaccharide deacetylase family protein [Gemmatimonadales bacterium]